MSRPAYRKIEETSVYLRFRAVAKEIWFEVVKWDSFARSTVGRQLVKAADSIPANLTEGDGRYSDGDSIHFFHIARASAREVLNWISVAAERNLISRALADRWEQELNEASKELNNLINYRRSTKNVRAVREVPALYESYEE